MEFFISSAWAQGGGAAQGDYTFLIMMVGLFVLMYFLMIRPQAKRQREHRDMVASLETGLEVVTGGGVLGRITEVGQDFVTVEVAEGVSLKVQKHTISAVLPKGTVKSA